MAFRQDGSDLVGETAAIRIVFDGDSGSIRRIENRNTGHLVVDGGDAAPWRLAAPGTSGRAYRGGIPWPATYHRLDPQPVTFEFEISKDAGSAELSWTTSDPGITVRVGARLTIDSVELWPVVQVAAGAIPPESFEYPIVVPRPLSHDGENDCLCYPAQAGWVIRSPLKRDPLVSFYPDGYSGSSVQFMAYYESGRGGFYFGCHDPHATCKRIRFGHDRASFEHLAWDQRRSASLDLGYPVEIMALTIGDWYEAADRYRAWALAHAPWCVSHKPNVGRDDRSDVAWLFEQIGLSVWGAPSSLDWSAWYRHYGDVAGTPLHIVSGWDWPQTLPPSLGTEGVFPGKFHDANVEAWRGHFVTPYLNDLFISLRAEDFFERWEPNVLFPYAAFPWLDFSEPPQRWLDGEAEGPQPETTTNLDFFLCPTTAALKDLHSWRDLVLARDHPVDGIFYDISSGNPENWSRCLRAEHGHSPGRGRGLITAYADLNILSKKLVRRETGRYYVQGVEVINETLVGSVDFYVSRACAGPLGRLETWIVGPEDEPGGGRELIPLFQAVYHDVGPVHEDGWITLDRAEGTLFYWIAARIYLVWGGVLSLQYSTSPPEALPDHDGPAETVLWSGSTHRWDVLGERDEEKEAFVKQLARARTGFGTRFLAYGRIVRPIPLEPEPLEVDFRKTLYGWGTDALVNSGTWSVPEVTHAVWADAEGAVGIFLVNLRGDRPVSTNLRADCARLWSLDLRGAEAWAITSEGEVPLGAVASDGTLDVPVTLAPRQVTLVEIAHGSACGRT